MTLMIVENGSGSDVDYLIEANGRGGGDGNIEKP